jgi:tripartite-type tricarboxylate transporter receptor subunit TctC
MSMLQRPAAGTVLGLAFCAMVCGSAQGQGAFPSKNITMVVPLPAGGTADLLCRYAAEKASAGLGQQVVVENRPGGAGGRVGMEQVLRSPPDGYTLLCSTQLSYSITHLVFTKASFDPRPLEPISVLATYPLIIITRKDLPANNLKEFLDYAKAGKVNYGNQGVANTGHLLGELMMLKGNFKMTGVFYRGSAPAINDLLGGTIDMVPDYLLANKGNIDAGKLKFIAVASEKRLKDYPNVPTMTETMPGVTSITWMAVSAPPGTPRDITHKISDAIAQGFKQADMQERILKLEATPLGTTPERMREMIQESTDIWGPVVKAANISID